jgi:hypothetical protein
VPPQWATKVMNRATADNQSAQAEDEGLEPTREWVKNLVDEIIADEFASPDLELAWLDEDEADPKGLEAVLEGRVKLGAVTLNEMRDARQCPDSEVRRACGMIGASFGIVRTLANRYSPCGFGFEIPTRVSR